MRVFGTWNIAADYQAYQDGVLEHRAFADHNGDGVAAREPIISRIDRPNIFNSPANPQALLSCVGFDLAVTRDQATKFASAGSGVARHMVDARCLGYGANDLLHQKPGPL